MINFSEQRTLTYTPQQLYDIVINIEQYDQFIIGCTGSKIIAATPECLKAELAIGYGVLKENYLSVITFKPYEFIQAECHTKPFKIMRNRWEFHPADPGCTIKFSIEFEFQKSLFNFVTDHIFLALSKDIMNAFIKRAQTLYAPNQTSA